MPEGLFNAFVKAEGDFAVGVESAEEAVYKGEEENTDTGVDGNGGEQSFYEWAFGVIFANKGHGGGWGGTGGEAPEE